MEERKKIILEALSAFVAQRPGFEPGNYDAAGYRADSRRVQRQRQDFGRLLLAVTNIEAIDADAILEAARGAYSGRLTFMHPDRKTRVCARDTFESVSIDYCAGQYWCTEYRAAACAVLAGALWDSMREDLPKEGTSRQRFKHHGNANLLPMLTEREYELRGRWMSAGDWLRASFRHWFGRGMQSRWFN